MTDQVLTITGVDGIGWTFPQYIDTEDGLYAAFPTPPDGITDWLAGVAIANQIPIGSTVNGISVRIKKYNPDDLDVYDYNVIIFDASDWSIISDDKADPTRWPVGPFNTYYGGATDMWGTTVVNTSFINSGNFALGFRGTKVGGSLYASIRVDYVEITIYYDGGVVFEENPYGPRAQSV